MTAKQIPKFSTFAELSSWLEDESDRRVQEELTKK